MNLRLTRRPLAGGPDQKDNLGFYGFHVKQRVIWCRVFLVPNIEIRLGEFMAPGVTVIPASTLGPPPNVEAISHRLLCHPNVDGALIN